MSDSWHTPMFRENIVRKLNDHITSLEMNVKTDAHQMESNIYEKATSEQEYLAFIGRLIVYLKDKSQSVPAKSVSACERSVENESPVVPQEGAPAAQTTCNGDRSNLSASPIAKSHQPNNQPHATPMPIPNHMAALALSKRVGPTSSQKLDILRTAIATVLQNPAWRTEEALANQRASIRQFGQYVAVQLGQIEDEEVLLATQQKIMSLVSKAI